MPDPFKIADAVKEVFGFLKEWNNADQKQKRYALKRMKDIKKATDIAEEIFVIVDDIIALARGSGVTAGKEFGKLETKYRKLVDKFNRLD